MTLSQTFIDVVTVPQQDEDKISFRETPALTTVILPFMTFPLFG